MPPFLRSPASTTIVLPGWAFGPLVGSGEDSKFGLHPNALLPFVETLDQLPRLRPCGLMTLALFSSDTAKVRPCFILLRRLRDKP